MKAGWKTTEFWLTALAVLAGAVASSGVLAEGSMALSIVGTVVAVLGAMGYGTMRHQQKQTAARLAPPIEPKLGDSAGSIRTPVPPPVPPLRED